MENKFFSLIVPVYNEEIRLKRSIPVIYDYLQKQSYSFEVIIVDDGSTDSSVSIVKEFQKQKENLVLVQSVNNKGKGHAIRHGMHAASGKVCAFIDADLSVSIESVFWLINFINDGYDIVIASRNIPGAWVKIKQPFSRRFMGKFFRDLTNFLLTKDISDITCGTKAFSDKAAEKIFPIQRLNDWSFDAEILFIAKKYDLKIKEIPVVWRDRHRSKVRFPRDIIRSFFGLIKIRIFDLLGRYDRD